LKEKCDKIKKIKFKKMWLLIVGKMCLHIYAYPYRCILLCEERKEIPLCVPTKNNHKPYVKENYSCSPYTNFHHRSVALIKQIAVIIKKVSICI
jgi:hypothetical protein